VENSAKEKSRPEKVSRVGQLPGIRCWVKISGET